MREEMFIPHKLECNQIARETKNDTQIKNHQPPVKTPQLLPCIKQTVRVSPKPLTVFMILAICLPTYIVKCLPASSVTTVSANVGTGFPTTFTVTDPLVSTSVSIQPMAGLPNNYGINGVAFEDCENKAFDKDANLLVELDPKMIMCSASVLKDPLKLLIGSERSISKKLYTLTNNGGVYTASQVDLVDQITQAFRASDDPYTDFIILIGTNSLARLNINSGEESMLTINIGFKADNYNVANTTSTLVLCSIIPKAVFVIDRTNFQVINNPAPSLDISTRLCELDNLNENNIFITDKDRIYKTDYTDSGTSLKITSRATSLAASQLTRPRNFGPYQYVVTISLAEPSIYLEIFNKVQLLREGLTLQNPIQPLSNSLTSLHSEYGDKAFYFGLVNYDGLNFQSYYLTVDRCVNKDTSNICQECLPGYYRVGTLPNNTCQTTIELAAGYGVVAGVAPSLAELCTATQCSDCISDFNNCKSCTTSKGWFLDQDNKKCFDSNAGVSVSMGKDKDTGKAMTCAAGPGCLECSEDYLVCREFDQKLDNDLRMPSGKGPNKETGAILPCADSIACLNCKDNYQFCNLCDTSAGFYTDAELKKCFSPTNPKSLKRMPRGKGVDIYTGKLVACESEGCKICSEDYKVCSRCKTAEGWYLDEQKSTCFTIVKDAPDFKKIPIGSGIDLSNGIVKPCTSHGCIDCGRDYMICLKCNLKESYYIDKEKGRCYAKNLTEKEESKMPKGRGPNKDTGEVQYCTEEGCANCSQDYLACAACDTSAAWYLSSADGKCYSSVKNDAEIAMPVGKGPNIKAGLVFQCESHGCYDCHINFNYCLRCDVNSGHFLNTSTQTCYTLPYLPIGSGANRETGDISYCEAGPNCYNCKSDYKKCTRCNDADDYFLENGDCISKPFINEKFGVNRISHRIEPCAVTNCVKCVDNYQICTECDQANGYILVNGSCEKNELQIAGIRYNRYMRSEQTWEIIFDRDVRIDNKCQDVPLLLSDKLGKTYTCSEVGCEIVDISSNGFSIRFNSQYSISYGTASLNKADCLSIYNFESYPVTVKIGYLGPTSSEEKLGRSARTAGVAASALSNSIMMSTSPALAMKADGVQAQMMLLMLLEGSEAVEAEGYLRIANKMECTLPGCPAIIEWVNSNTKCETSDTLARNDVNCTIFTNYGDDLIIVYIILLTTVMLTVAGSFALKRIDLRHKKTRKIIGFFKDTYGLTFFIAKMDAGMFTALYFSAVNMYYSEGSRPLVVGDVLASSLAGLLLASTVCQYLTARWIVGVLTDLQIADIEAYNGRKKNCQLLEVINFKAAPKWARLISVLYSELRVPDKPIYIYNQFFVPVKHILQVIALVLLIKYPVTQTICVLMIETAYFAHYLISNIKVSLSLRITEILIEILMIVYLALRLTLTAAGDLFDLDRQQNIAIAMLMTLYGIIVVSISFALFSLILILFQLCADLCKKETEDEKVERLIKEEEAKLNESSGYVESSILYAELNDNNADGKENKIASFKLNDEKKTIQKVAGPPQVKKTQELASQVTNSKTLIQPKLNSDHVALQKSETTNPLPNRVTQPYQNQYSGANLELKTDTSITRLEQSPKEKQTLNANINIQS